MSKKDKILIAIATVIFGIFFAWSWSKPPSHTLIGVEGTWDCPPNATPAATVCVKRVQPR
jgi:hypothetical protein